MDEGTTFDKKSLLCFPDDPKRWDWQKLAKHCIAFANARGGKLHFGIEDKADAPPASQRIDPSLPDRLRKGIGSHCINVAVSSAIITVPNGGEVLELTIFPSRQTVASDTGGRFYMRVADESKPVMPEDLPRLLAEKDAYVWEAQTTRKISISQADPLKLARFIADIRASDRVSAFIRDQSDAEILDHFVMSRDGVLTNLGILWVGRREDRALLLHAPAIQFIKYDARDEKVAKREWSDFSLNPKELIEAVWKEIPDWREFTELRDGLFPEPIPHYDESVIRELLANALAHRPYTTRGDIFIKLYPEYLEVHNPGLFPLGVTPQNILHTTIQRNPHLAKIFYALNLMEREGSGYDRMYDVLLSRGRPVPLPREENDRVIVRVERRIVRPEVVGLLAAANQKYDLRQRERICLGLIAQYGLLKATDFNRILDLPDATRVRTWLGSLLAKKIILSQGKTKATGYFVNPELLRNLKEKSPTTLLKIEPHRLRHLVLEDLETYSVDVASASAISEIHKRVGSEISMHKVKRAIKDLQKTGEIGSTGKRGRGAGYFISAKSRQIPPLN